MKTTLAIFLTVIGQVSGEELVPCIIYLVWFGSCIWAGIDSSKIELKKFKTQISCGPFVLFLGCLVLWIVVFPWYLIVRSKIKNGTAQLKDPNVKQNGQKLTSTMRQYLEKKCPHCGELVLTEAKLCKHCGSTLEPESSS